MQTRRFDFLTEPVAEGGEIKTHVNLSWKGARNFRLEPVSQAVAAAFTIGALELVDGDGGRKRCVITAKRKPGKAAVRLALVAACDTDEPEAQEDADIKASWPEELR